MMGDFKREHTRKKSSAYVKCDNCDREIREGERYVFHAQKSDGVFDVSRYHKACE